MTDPLFAEPRRRIGPAEALLAKTLRAWHTDGVLVGDKWASARGVLRDAARAVDLAREDARADEASARSFGWANKTYAELMALYLVSEEVTSGDSLDALIANISGPPIRYTTES